MYAKDTSVSVERSKSEIEKLISKYGAAQFFSGWDNKDALIGFRMHDRFIRFRLPMPQRETPCIRKYGFKETKRLTDEQLAQKTRQRWRALLLVLKAKFEAVESGISDFDTEFLGNITVANGQTMGEWAKPQLKEIYATGNMPLMITGSRDE